MNRSRLKWNPSKTFPCPTALTVGRSPSQVSPTLRVRYTRSSKQKDWAILVRHLLCARHFARIISLNPAKPGDFFYLHFIDEETEAQRD